jgi:hypothetical protein
MEDSGLIREYKVIADKVFAIQMEQLAAAKADNTDLLDKLNTVEDDCLDALDVIWYKMSQAERDHINAWGPERAKVVADEINSAACR